MQQDCRAMVVHINGWCACVWVTTTESAQQWRQSSLHTIAAFGLRASVGKPLQETEAVPTQQCDAVCNSQPKPAAVRERGAGNKVQVP